MKRILLTCFMLAAVLISTSAIAQDRTVTGRVTGADDGLPLPQVTVLLKGTTTGTPTDSDGNYRLSVPANGGTLVFRYLGYVTQEIAIDNKTIINVQLVPDSQSLGEVVVVAYGEEKRATLSSSVAVVNKEAINTVPIASIDQVLQGQAAGLNVQATSGQPGASSTITIRGIGSINGNIEPLFVIDGVIVDEDNFRSLNPNDVENVSILKDASASAIYGNRGANGVIVITTKQGRRNTPVRINYSMQYGQTDQLDPNFTPMNSRQYLELQRELGVGEGDGLTDAELATMAQTDTDWTDIFRRTGTSMSHDLSITAGGQNTTLYTSVGYFRQEGTTLSSDLERYTFRNNLTTDLTDRFTVSTKLTVNYSESNFAQNEGTGQLDNPFINPFIAQPFVNPFNDDGTLNLVGTDYTTVNGTNLNGFLNTPFITLSTATLDTRQRNRIRAIGSIDMSLEVFDGFVAGGSVGMDFIQTQALNITNPNSLRGDITPDQNSLIKGSQNENNITDRSFTSRAFLKYNTVISDDHSLDVSVFGEYFNRKRTSFGFTGFGIDPKLIGSGNGLTAGTVTEGGAQFYIPTVGSGEAEIATFSYFGVARYNFKQTYGGQVSIRRDASSRFNSTNKWGTFWSVSGYWNMNENVLSGVDIIDQLKLRASYGTTGNERILGTVFGGANAAFTLYGRGDGYQNAPGYFINQLENPDLKWETSTQLNIGTDFSLWQGKLTGTIDYYIKNTSDLFFSQPISLISGFGSLPANIGEMENRGIEFTFNYQVINTNDLRVSVNFNAGRNENEVKALAQDDFVITGQTALSVGDPFGSFYRVRYAGVNPANGDPLFLDVDGNVTDQYNLSDRVLLDKTNQPLWTGGFGANVNYKGFSFSTLFSFVTDRWRTNGSFGVVNDVTLAGFANQSTFLNQAWRNPGDIAQFPRLTFTGFRQLATDFYLEDASFLRWRNATLGYDFSKEFLNKIGAIVSARVFVQGQNLWTSTKWRGFDPESNLGGSFFEYPTSRIWTVGLNVGF